MFFSLALSVSLSLYLCVSLYVLHCLGRKREYKLWRADLTAKKKENKARVQQEKDGSNGSNDQYQSQSLISFPYVLTPATKAAVLELDASK